MFFLCRLRYEAGRLLRNWVSTELGRVILPACELRANIVGGAEKFRLVNTADG